MGSSHSQLNCAESVASRHRWTGQAGTEECGSDMRIVYEDETSGDDYVYFQDKGVDEAKTPRLDLPHNTELDSRFWCPACSLS